MTSAIVFPVVDYILCAKDNHEALKHIIEFTPSKETGQALNNSHTFRRWCAACVYNNYVMM